MTATTTTGNSSSSRGSSRGRSGDVGTAAASASLVVAATATATTTTTTTTSSTTSNRPPASASAPSISTAAAASPARIQVAGLSSIGTIAAGPDHDPKEHLTSPSTPSTASPRSPTTPKSPFRFTTKKSAKAGQQQGPSSQQQHSSSMPAATEQAPPSHSAPPTSSSSTSSPPQGSSSAGAGLSAPPLNSTKSTSSLGDDDKKSNRGFFSTYKSTKASGRLAPNETIRKVSEDNMSRDADRPALINKAAPQDPKRSGRPSPCDGHARANIVADGKVESADRSNTRHAASADSASSLQLPGASNKRKPNPFSLLRTKSMKGDEEMTSPVEGQAGHPLLLQEKPVENDVPLRTAPPRQENERSFREMMSSTVRHHSEDRKASTVREPSSSREAKENRPPGHGNKESSGHTFFNNIKSSASKGAGAISKGIFGRGAREHGTHVKEHSIDDEHYEIKVINKSLVEQTRITRISKRLENSRDKTEFWMPAFPWRAIDYLNYKGSEMEGLYRVPGSGPQIKKWQRRFDEELDIDLFEQDDLYDINIIGSMLKAWLRELPDELLPKPAQDRVNKECQGKQYDRVPQILVDELSNLSPFNYYLLFAITCHLSLLLAHSDKNKMDFRNLCICFQPCMKMDLQCFKWLVCDWRDCWKGCKTESPYIEAEYAIFEKERERELALAASRKSSNEGRSASTAMDQGHAHDERGLSSSDSNKPVSAGNDGQHTKNMSTPNGKEGKRGAVNTNANGTSNPTLTPVQETVTPRKGSNDLRPLSPIKPLSPIGF